jgi:hypothetical protein
LRNPSRAIFNASPFAISFSFLAPTRSLLTRHPDHPRSDISVLFLGSSSRVIGV